MNAKYTVVILLIFSCNLVFLQKKDAVKYPLSQRIANDYKLVFLKHNKDYNLYSKPRILYKNKLKLISGFDDNNYSGAQINISNNKKYFVMDNIIKGYIYTQIDSVLHENYTCVIIDIKNSKIVYQMQTDCGGKWNTKNQWVYDNKVLF